MFGIAVHPPRPTAPVVASPRPYEVSFGAVWGRVGPNTTSVIVRFNGKTRGRAQVQGRHFSLSVALPRRDVTLRVFAIGPGGHASARVGPIFGLPRAANPRLVHAYKKPTLERRLRRLTRRFPGISASYVEDLTTGAGGAWNAGAHFPAASTLKVAFAVTLMRRLRGPPAHGSYLDSTMRQMLDYSDNGAANTLLAAAGGPGRVNETMHRLGLRSTEVYGGYLVGTRAQRARIPIKTDEQPSFGFGKYTTAHDLARLLALVHLASGNRGAIAKRLHGEVSVAEARYLLYVLAHVHDPGKLDRYLPGHRVAVLHKAGWISQARHDAGLVYWLGGVFVAAVMTWNSSGVGVSSDMLAGRVARSTLTFLQRTRKPNRRPPRPLRQVSLVCRSCLAQGDPATAVAAVTPERTRLLVGESVSLAVDDIAPVLVEGHVLRLPGGVNDGKGNPRFPQRVGVFDGHVVVVGDQNDVFFLLPEHLDQLGVCRSRGAKLLSGGCSEAAPREFLCHAPGAGLVDDD